jgi:putative ABC transport system permease protein
MEKENVIYLPAKRPLVANHDAFLQELTRRPGIVNAAFASSLPSNATQVVSSMSWEGKDPSDDETWQFICIDERYLDTLGIKLAEGRPFTEFKPVNDLPYFIVNERAAREMGLARPVGSRFSLGDLKGTLIGIVKDFHYMPLRQDIRPLLLFIGPGEFDTILVKFRPERGGFDGILAGIRDLWDKYAPGLPFSYEFLDAAYDLNYRSERRMNAEFKYFTFLGLFISCLGLVGLVAYVADRKRKEIGIRRVLGASLPRVVGRIQREFLGPVVISNAIAWPVAFWIMKSWLRGFVVHAGISPAVFAGSALATLALAAATVGFQSIKAARESPARSLRNE